MTPCSQILFLTLIVLCIDLLNILVFGFFLFFFFLFSFLLYLLLVWFLGYLLTHIEITRDTLLGQLVGAKPCLDYAFKAVETYVKEDVLAAAP